MKLNFPFTLTLLLFASRIGIADPSQAQQFDKRGTNKLFVDARAPDQQPSYSGSEINKMVRDAKTSEGFARLADYFDYRAMEFEQKSQEELAELQRLLALPHHARSYPTQVDNTRALIKRYRVQALKCSARADIYREQSTQSDGSN